jgi:transcriptional regulator with PAS, ATPase and Fis domain
MSRAESNRNRSDADAPAETKEAGVVRLDVALGIVSLDETAARLMGMPAEALLGRKLEEAVDLANLLKLMKGGISFSNQIIVAGSTRLACDYTLITEDESVVGGVLTLLSLPPGPTADSSDQLKELLRSTGDIFNSDYDGIVIVDREGIVVMVNLAFAQVLNVSPQAIIGKHVHQAYPNSQPSHLPAVMQSGTPEIGITHYLNGKQVYASLFPLFKDGTVIGGIGKILFKDVREITLIANRLQAAPESRNQSRNVAQAGSMFRYDVKNIVGHSQKMQELKEAVLRVAQNNSNVLLLGESGTGKELFAHAIHAASNRRYSQFVKINCAAIPEHLLESELFGYAEGAFTGARKGGQLGKFQQAHNGTIFLDEIGDMPLYMQAKMLRVLEEKELTQLGSAKARMIDVRVVAATNSNLQQLVKEGKFREDLYYRLKVVTLDIPPLRERMDDISAITETFIGLFNAEFGLHVQGLDREAWEIIRRYHWPGNIRELRNVIESAFNAVDGPTINRAHLPDQLLQLFPLVRAQAGTTPEEAVKEFVRCNLGKKDFNRFMDEFEKLLVQEAVKFSRGNKLQAAKVLGISRQWLYKKLQKQPRDDGDVE